MSNFRLTEQHLKLLKSIYITDYDGVPTVDSKRPFGNSSITYDIAEILDIEYDEDEGLSDEQESLCIDLFEELTEALQIVLQNAEVELGDYVKKDKYGNNWEKAK